MTTTTPASVNAMNARLASGKAAARAAMTRMGERAAAADADRAELTARGWGAVFTASPQWRNRTSYVAGPCPVPGPLEERALGTADLGHAAELGPVPGFTAPITARCDIRRASPGNATVVRWHGPVRPGPVPEGGTKPDACLAPELLAVSLPFVAYWTGLSRAVLDDNQQLAAAIDTRLLRGIGLAVDDQVAEALAADDGLAEVAGADLGEAIRAAVGQLAVSGYYGNTTVIIAAADLPAAGHLGDLPLLGVGAIIPAAGLPAGTAIAADLRAAVQVRYHGPAKISTTDSHASQFTANTISLLAEVRVLGAVVDPAAAVKATTGAAVRTAGKSKRAA